MRGGFGGQARGAAMVLGAMALLGFTDNLVRLIADAAGLWQFHLTRSAFALPLLLAAVLALGLPLRPRRPAAVIARSGAQTGAMLLYFGALAATPIAQAGAALFTAPLWVLLFGAALFGRPVGARRLGAVALGFAGTLVMLRPDPATLSLLTLMPVAAGALYGLSNLLTRECCAEEPVGALLWTFFGGLALASALALLALEAVEPPAAWLEAAPFLAAGWRAPSPFLLGVVFVQAAGTLLAVGMVARSYQAAEAATIAVFEYSYLLLAGLWAWILWGEALSVLDLAGIAMIAAAGALAALA